MSCRKLLIFFALVPLLRAQTVPTRPPRTPGYPPATELPDGTLPAANADGNFILGPAHPAAPEALPLVEAKAGVKLTHDPDGRATMGGSSGGSCALIMAWYRPDLYHRVLTYSGTFVNQQWPYDPATPHGAWEFHAHLIPDSTAKPLRIWMEVGDRDLYNPHGLADGYHDWVLANENMARVLAAKHYAYQFVFAENAGHVDGAVKKQTLPEALEYVWRGYHAAEVTPSSSIVSSRRSFAEACAFRPDPPRHLTTQR
jgi:hypothetical protein